MKIFALLETKRNEILSLASQYGAYNVRLFGSVIRNDFGPDSDIDFLVDLEPDRDLLDLGMLWVNLEHLLGCQVDVVAEHTFSNPERERILKEAVPLADIHKDFGTPNST